MLDVTLLGRADERGAAETLARAFDDSPVYRAVFSRFSDVGRGRALVRVKAGFVSAMAHHGESRVARDGGVLAGTTIVTAPGRYPLSWLDEIRQSTGCATTGPIAIARFLRLSAYIRRVHIKEPHFYLFAIGVEPSRQGRGVGKALLADLNARADAAGAPCYLETEKAINVRLYESVGYRVLTDELIPGLGVRMWTMRRPPGVTSR
jgi:ribosomal protein S18 acetylase RimI-like enzyme